MSKIKRLIKKSEQISRQTHSQVQAHHQVEATHNIHTYRRVIVGTSKTTSTALVKGEQSEHLFNENRCKILLCSH